MTEIMTRSEAEVAAYCLQVVCNKEKKNWAQQGLSLCLCLEGRGGQWAVFES